MYKITYNLKNNGSRVMYKISGLRLNQHLEELKERGYLVTYKKL